MDLNLVVVCGRLATDAELRVFDSGTKMIRYLITTRVDYPRKRTDVIPVILWEPAAELIEAPGQKGERLWVCGAVQRRYWEGSDGRQSRIEVVAEQVNFKDLDQLEPVPAD